ncbi:MobF family relaxase [Rhodococcus artemisiae]|uniref:MobF family relaxase n=1 Tax=Rhodococcus artemisiae TaxID=714159 RepID=A0ABU7LJQ5_9NOCA|nr:MobF family relaxase [Rhodococcus artemisiae]MEE2061806.1 MobF family relaxase [Rhodococcus artemisiae]
MSAKKLTAGDGYEYLTRQVAAADSTELGRSTLSDYYSAKGETPGRWMGNGLESLTGVDSGSQVEADQMRALFGEGRHPNATEIEKQTIAEAVTRGLEPEAAARLGMAETRLGNPFRIYAGATEFRQVVAQRFTDYNTARGAEWNARIDDEVRAEIRTKVGHELFEKEYGRPPVDERELSGFVAKGSRQQTTAVAGYDLTFTPVKSVSTLWAVAPLEISEKVESAHHAAVEKAIRFVEKNATYTRLGTNGVQQVDVDGLLCAAFTHRDSRAGDPNLHTHVAVSNKVRASESGRWLALDGRPLHKLFVAASEVYNTELEVEMRSRLGVRFTEREQTDRTKRPVREIVGIDPNLNEVWSSRRAMIEVRRAELASAFQRDHGREPTPIEAIALAQQANLETREAKHEPKSHAEQRQEWRQTAVGVLGGEHELSDMVRSATNPAPSKTRAEITDEWILRSAEQILTTISAHQSRWQKAHVIAEAQRAARAADLSEQQVETVVSRLVETVTSPEMSVPLGRPEELGEPGPLRRRDGSSVYTTAGTQLYTSEAVLDAEQRIVDSAMRTDGRRATEIDVDLALLEQAANDFDLNTGQTALVREMATSGARVQLALAPAGTGKTTAMAALARAWENSGGNVIGLAPTATAADALRKDLGAQTDTMGKLIHTLTEQPLRRPDWFDSIGADTLIVVDEAGMASTADLDRVIEFVVSRGGSVRLIGDDQQLASVSAGGVLRDVATTAGAVTLTDVVRFKGAGERAATLALRDGDPAAIGFYIDQGRVHVADKVAAEDIAYAAWQQDRARGLDTVLLAPNREMVRGLNERARTDRLAATGPVLGASVTLSDGLPCSAGDMICTRRNNRMLALTRTDFVRNGDRWTVDEVHPDGSLTVTNVGNSRSIQLPAEYVAEYTTLGYARTIHAAQGITADTCHTVATGTESRQLAYVAMTRGKESNHLYFGTASDGDPENVINRETLLPPTAVDIFTGILARGEAQKSATSTARDLTDPATRIAHAAAAYDDAIGTAAEHAVGAEVLARIDAAAEKIRSGLTDAPAYPVLRKHLARIAIEGHDPVEVLDVAAHHREIDTALDVAAVLDWRLDPSGAHSAGTGPLPWLPAIPPTLAADEQWGPYLSRRAELVSDLAAQIETQAGEYTPENAPMWACPLLDTDGVLLRDLAVWRASHEVDDADRRPTGPDQYVAASRRHQRRLDTRATAILGDPNAAASRWRALAESVEPRLLKDPFWPELADRLAAVRRTGVDVHGLVRRGVADRPLPTDLPAAALWWRLSGELSRTTSDAAAAVDRTPSWGATLSEVLGSGGAEALSADPVWNKLVAVIDAADPADWTAHDLLTVAHDLAVEGQDGETLDTRALATALPWRVEAVLAHTAAVPGEGAIEPVSPEIEEEVASLAGAWIVEQRAPDAHVPSRTRSVRPLESTSPSLESERRTSTSEISVPSDLEEPPDLDLPPPPDVEFDQPVDVADRDAWAAGLLATARATPDRYTELSLIERLDRLNRDLAAAQRRLDSLWQATLDGTTEHLAAALPMLTDMQRRVDEQRPYAADAADAHRGWTDESREAEAAANTVARLAEQARTARAAGDNDQAAALDADHALAAMVADAAATAASAAKADHDAAEQRLVEMAGGAANIVSSTDVEIARLEAEERDLRAFAEARRDVEQLSGAVSRAESVIARAYAETAPIVPGDGPAPHVARAAAATRTLDRPAETRQQPTPQRDLDHQLPKVGRGDTVEQPQTHRAAVSEPTAARTIDEVTARIKKADKVAAIPTAELKSKIKQAMLTQRMNPTAAGRAGIEKYRAELQRRAQLPAAERTVEDAARQRINEKKARTEPGRDAHDSGPRRDRDRGLDR